MKYDPTLPVSQEKILSDGMYDDPAIVYDKTQTDQMVDGPEVRPDVDLTDLPPGSYSGYPDVTDISEDESLHNMLSGNSYTMTGDDDD